MKTYNKLIALVAAFGLVGVSFAQDDAAGGNLTDNISISGFIDTSYNKLDSDTAGNDDENIGLDEVEIDFLFGFGSVTAEAHLDAGADGNVGIEQAHVSYDVGNGFSVTIGKYGSSLGLEGEDPTGLSTYSRAYSNDGTDTFDLGNVDNAVREGIAFGYAGDGYSVRISFDDSDAATPDGEINAGDDLDTEVSLSYTGFENLSIGGGIQTGNGDQSNEVVNVNAEYSMGKAVIGGEYSTLDSATDEKAYQLLVTYPVSDILGVSLRYSEVDRDGGATGDYDKFTIAPSYQLTDDLGAILEYSEGTVGAAEDFDVIALELTLTF